MRFWITIGLWLFFILFPIAWLGTLSPESEKFIDWLLAPEWLHVAMHLIIYAGLIILILAKQRREGGEISFAALVMVILAVGVAQEVLQYITADKWAPPMRALRSAGFDLMVDLAGGMIGLGIYLNLVARKNRAFSPPLDGLHGQD